SFWECGAPEPVWLSSRRLEVIAPQRRDPRPILLSVLSSTRAWILLIPLQPFWIHQDDILPVRPPRRLSPGRPCLRRDAACQMFRLLYAILPRNSSPL